MNNTPNIPPIKPNQPSHNDSIIDEENILFEEFLDDLGLDKHLPFNIQNLPLIKEDLYGLNLPQNPFAPNSSISPYTIELYTHPDDMETFDWNTNCSVFGFDHSCLHFYHVQNDIAFFCQIDTKPLDSKEVNEASVNLINGLNKIETVVNEIKSSNEFSNNKIILTMSEISPNIHNGIWVYSSDNQLLTNEPISIDLHKNSAEEIVEKIKEQLN